MLSMEERIRITFDVPERVRRALNICAARTDRSVGEVIQGLVEEHMVSDLELADKAIAEGTATGAKKRGRPRKPSD